MATVLRALKGFHSFGKEYAKGDIVKPTDWLPLSPEERKETVRTRIAGGFLEYDEVDEKPKSGDEKPAGGAGNTGRA